MNVFDVIGPVMVGPSSSHTAGALRIAAIAGQLLGEEPVRVQVRLHGSFERTFRGHGTDRAILAGLMGMKADDARIRNSLKIAGQRGITYTFTPIVLKDAHPNTLQIKAEGRSGRTVQVTGSSIGGGSILIKSINGMVVEFSGQYHTLAIAHADTPGTIAAVTQILGELKINIAFMKVFRTRRGGEAIMIIETDQPIDSGIKEILEHIPNVSRVSVIKPV
ncbi:MAG TPA: L-serine ammonia-lyase, iron-sulfur-dependent, subunit beta [Clostridiales bacterium]|nr:L-serine ammonia-lyase, iron-sulfur-dependent, subunit beta [Clostridiales bacterium]